LGSEDRLEGRREEGREEEKKIRGEIGREEENNRTEEEKSII
jgi:hypothetical protein